jgi:putative redox protein
MSMIIQRSSKHSIVAAPGEGARVSIEVRGHTVETDQPQRMGGTDTAPTPLELVGVSLAGCIALYAGRYCDAESLDADGLAVEVKPFWRDDPGRIARFDVLVHLPDSVPEAHRSGLEEAARKCPVHHTLTYGPEITLQFQELASAGAAAAD